MIDWNVIAGWVAGTAMVVGVAWAPVACNSNNNAKIAEAVERGVNPMVARCAYGAGTSPADCTILAAKMKEAKDD